MYHFNRRVARKKKRYAFLRFLWKFAIFVAVIVAVIWYLRRPQVNINGVGAKFVPVADDGPVLRHIAEPLYGFDFPADWKEIERRTKPLNYIIWKGTTKESAARTLEIYTDTIPVSLAINRLLPVTNEGDRLGVDIASENCVLFNDYTIKLTPAEAAKAKVLPLTFQKVPFLCDIPNSLRNVIGAGSAEGLNRVSLTGIKGGKHKYFFVYTDHSAHPEDANFPAILRSFRAL